MLVIHNELPTTNQVWYQKLESTRKIINLLCISIAQFVIHNTY